jgi:hypothetical protein
VAIVQLHSCWWLTICPTQRHTVNVEQAVRDCAQVASTELFLNTWLVGYSIVLGPVIGVVMADYWLVRHRQLDIDALYRAGDGSAYWYQVRDWGPPNR